MNREPRPAFDFSELLDASTLGTEGVVVMLRAYVDASLLNSGIFCVAAVAFGIENAKKANHEWIALHGTRQSHMTDMHSRKKEFKGLSDQDADKLCRESVAIINRYASFISVISCDAKEVVPSLPTDSAGDGGWILDAYKGVYPCCMHWALIQMGAIAGHQRDGIAYWFELGDEYWKAADRYLSKINSPEAAPLRERYALASKAFLPATDARLFEAADIVAWEWAKHVERKAAGQPVRPSLIALMDGAPCIVNDKPFCRTDKRAANHYTGLPVAKYMNDVSQILNATSVDEMRKILAEELA